MTANWQFSVTVGGTDASHGQPFTFGVDLGERELAGERGWRPRGYGRFAWPRGRRRAGPGDFEGEPPRRRRPARRRGCRIAGDPGMPARPPGGSPVPPVPPAPETLIPTIPVNPGCAPLWWSRTSVTVHSRGCPRRAAPVPGTRNQAQRVNLPRDHTYPREPARPHPPAHSPHRR